MSVSSSRRSASGKVNTVTHQLAHTVLVIRIPTAANKLQPGGKNCCRCSCPRLCSLLPCQSKGAELLRMILLRPELG